MRMIGRGGLYSLAECARILQCFVNSELCASLLLRS